MPVQKSIGPFIAAVPLNEIVIEEEVGPRHRNHQHQLAESIEMLSPDKISHMFHCAAHDEQYNRRGLFLWEKEAIERYFIGRKHLLLIGAGGGREVIALSRLGYEVDGYECHPQLVEAARNLLVKENLSAQIQIAPRDQCPDGNKVYDGLIVGWGAYMLIQGRQHRIDFLRQLRSRAKESSPVLLSFYDRDFDTRRFKIIKFIGNVLRRMTGGEQMELGDDLFPNYVHYFIRDEVESELRAGGFDLKFYSTKSYGHAVGFAI